MARIANGLDYHTLPRRKLQLLCKKHGIPANKTNLYMIEALSSLDKEKLDEPSHEGGTKLESAHKEGDNKIRESQRCNAGDGAQLPVQSTESGGTVGQFLTESIGPIPYGLQVGIGEAKQIEGPGSSDSFLRAVVTSGVCVSLEDLGTKLGADTIEHLQHLEFKETDVSIPEDAKDCALALKDDNHTLPSNPPQSLQFKDTFASQVKGETNVSVSFEGLETQDNGGRMLQLHGDSSNSTLEVLEIQVNGNNISQLDDDIAAIQDPKIEDTSQVIKEEVIKIEDAFVSQVENKTKVSIFFDGLETQGNEERILQLHVNNSNSMVCTPLDVLDVQVNGKIVSQSDGVKNFAANRDPKIEDASQVVREEDLSISAADLELGDPDAIISPAKRNWNVPTSLEDHQSPNDTQDLASDSYLSPPKINSSHVLHEDLEFKGAPVTAERMKNSSNSQNVMSNEDDFGLPKSQCSQISVEMSFQETPPLEDLRQISSFHIEQSLSVQQSQFQSITSSGHCQQGNSYIHDEKQVASCKLDLKDVPKDVDVSALSYNSDAVAVCLQEPLNQLSTLCIPHCNNLEDSITSRHTNARQDSYEDMVNVPAFSQEKRIDTDMETSDVSEISVCSAEIHFGIIVPTPSDGLFLDNVSSNASEGIDTDTCPMVHETKCIIPSEAWSRQETSHGSKRVKGVSDLQKVCVYNRSSHLKDAWHQVKLNAKHKQHYKRTPFVRATWLSRSLMKGRDKRALLLKQRRTNTTLNNTSCSYMETSDYLPDASPLNSCTYEPVRAIPETVRRYSCSSMENLNVPYSPSYEQQAKQLFIFGRKRFIERAMREAARRKQERLGVAPNLSASPMKIASAAQNAHLECSEQNKKTRINLYGAKTSEIQKRHQEQFKTPLKGKSFQKARKMASQLASGQREQVLRARRGILASENKAGDCHMRGGTFQNS